MAHAPFDVGQKHFIGLAPGATYFVLPIDGRDETKLTAAIAWLVSHREEFNIRLIQDAGWHIPVTFGKENYTLLRNTRDFPHVRALAPAVEAGILVVAANGNTALETNLPPATFLAVGGYQDHGFADHRFHEPVLDEPWGRNGDGHMRPDVLAPRFYVPNRLEAEAIAYFGGSSSASAQVAGLCALILALHPALDAQTLKQVLIDSGDPLPRSANPAPRVNAQRALELIERGGLRRPVPLPPPLQRRDPLRALSSDDAGERALALSALAQGPAAPQASPEVFWRYTSDGHAVVRKAAYTGWWRASRQRSQEIPAEPLWEALRREPDLGVRGLIAALLEEPAARREYLSDWVAIIRDPNWAVRAYARAYLKQHWQEAPELPFSWTPEDVEANAKPVIEWYSRVQPNLA